MRRRLLRTFSLQTGLLLFALLVVLQVGINTFWHRHLVAISSRQVTEITAEFCAELDESMEKFGPADTAQMVRNIAENDDNPGLVILLRDAKGSLSGDFSMWPAGLVPAARWGVFALDATKSPTGSPLLVRTRTYPSGVAVMVGHNLTSLNKLRQQTQEIVIISIALSALLSALLAVGFGLLLNRRMAGLEKNLHHIAAEGFSARLPTTGWSFDGLERLSRTINAMLERLEGLLALNTYSQQALAHDLRTPLARVRNTLADLKTKYPRDKSLPERIRDIDNLLSYSERLLALSDIGTGRASLTFTTVAFSELLTEVIETYGASLTEKGLLLQVDILPHIRVEGDTQLLLRALTNLLDNVMSYGLPGTCLSIRTGLAPMGMCTLEMNNPFNAAKRSPFQHHGLGLQLVKAIAKAHGGTCTHMEAAGHFHVALAVPCRAAKSPPERLLSPTSL